LPEAVNEGAVRTGTGCTFAVLWESILAMIIFNFCAVGTAFEYAAMDRLLLRYLVLVLVLVLLLLVPVFCICLWSMVSWYCYWCL